MDVKQRVSDFKWDDYATKILINDAAIRTFDEFDSLRRCGAISDEEYVAFIIEYFYGFDYYGFD